MSIIKLIISDLHLADGHPILDGFDDAKQSALEGLLRTASTPGPLGSTSDLELIINGDCFDFLTTAPYDTQGTVDAKTALSKLEKIIAAHPAFFEALHHFVETPGRHVTFIIGNHDLELCFAEVRQRISEAIGVTDPPSVNFCLARFYRPLPDIHIEHGNQYDFWNHGTSELWDDQGQPLTTSPSSITLPDGSHYFQHASHRISLAYPYFDHFEPSMNSMRQIALLCLLNPKIVIETARDTMEMLADPRQALANLKPGEERIPATLFEHAMRDFAAFQLDIAAHKTHWTEPGEQDNSQAMANLMAEFTMLHQTLALPPLEAVAAICTPTTYQMGESVATGMQQVLKKDPSLRYTIAGHTHMVRIDPVSAGSQSYLNTASWTTRLALLAPGEVTPELFAWLQQPDWTNIPLRDVTQLTFAMVNVTPERRSSASLCVWDGGSQGSYRVLA